MLTFPFFVSAESRFRRGYYFEDRMWSCGSISVFAINDFFRKYHTRDLFANKKAGQAFNTPLVYTSLDYLQKANYHYSKHDYPSCANHLRKALEERLKVLLPQNEHYAEYTDAETGITEIKKLKTLHQYLEKFIGYCESNGIDASELVDLRNLKDWYFNPFSHDNIQKRA